MFMLAPPNKQGVSLTHSQNQQKIYKSPAFEWSIYVNQEAVFKKIAVDTRMLKNRPRVHGNFS